MNNASNVYDYIKTQENEFRQHIEPVSGWRWNMLDHIRTTVLYSSSQLVNGKDEFTPVKNITRPILNLQHRTEDIEIKDIDIFVNDAENYHLSFLVKKYHDNVFVPENDLYTFFDELNISRIDFGGGLSKQLNKPRPEVVPLQSIVFCDQSDILSGPICLRHFYSPGELLEMAKVGWGSTKNGATATLEEVIQLAKEERKEKKDGITVRTPGKYIEVYELHGNLPKRYASPTSYNASYTDTEEEYADQLFICCFFQKKGDNQKQGIILYTKEEPESPFKLIKRDPIYGRGLGFGGAEELFEAQVWTNYNMIRQQRMLESASITALVSTDPTFSQKNKIRNLENLDVLDISPGTDVKQLDTVPRSLKLFEQSTLDWETHAKEMGGAQEAVQGNEPQSGTPFASLQAQIQQSMGLHQYRRGQYAKHIEEIYRDWIIPHIQREITKGTKFLAELTLDELQMVSENMVTVETNKYLKERILNGEFPTPDEVQAYKEQTMAQFKKRGSKHFLEILKGEFKNTELGVKVSVAGKSKDVAAMMDKITGVLRFMFQSPYLLQSAPIAKLFNEVVELAGLEPIDLSNFKVPLLPARRMTEHMDFKDLPPEAQQGMLEVAGIAQGQGPQPGQPLI